MRTLSLSLLVALCGLTACPQTIAVTASSAGLEKLQLHGDAGAEGTILRAIKHGAVTTPQGARVRVMETWLIRKESNTRPPGYRIQGLYDPTKQNDGFMLPRHAVDTFYSAVVLPEAKVRLAVPARWFEPTP